MANERHFGDGKPGDIWVVAHDTKHSGVELLGEVELEDSGKHWIYRLVDLKSSGIYWKGTPSITQKDSLADRCPYRLVKSSLSPLKGDILAGKDKTTGGRVVLYYQDEESVHRLTPGVGLTTPQGHGTLEFYERQLKDLRILSTSNLASVRFSDL
jgi:hypothetical protein